MRRPVPLTAVWRAGSGHAATYLVLVLYSLFGCVPWMTTVQLVATTAAAAAAAAALSIIAAAGGSEVNRRKERERDLRTPTKHGYPNDSIMHWIHSVAANQRNYQSPSWPGMFLNGGKMSTHEPPEVIMCFKQHSYWQLASICACSVSRGWWCAALFFPYVSLAFIHCGLTENECTKSLSAFRSHHQRVPCQGTANAFCLFPSVPRS